MRRRTFVTGSLLAAAAAASTEWWAHFGQLGSDGQQPTAARKLPDGRMLVRDAALAFGTTVAAAAVHDSAEQARRALAAALNQARAVDNLMSVYRTHSQVGRLNAAGALDHPDPRLVKVLEFSQGLAALSDGAFDVTVQPLWQLFVECKRKARMPSPDEVASARVRVDWTALQVSSRRIAFDRPGMAITLNGVAQGYAADLALQVLREQGIHDALIDTGEYAAAGARQPGRPWSVGIQHPRESDAVIAAIAMDGRCLATSGDYATSFSDDYLYHHIFDPRTGYSPRNLSSVAVAAGSGMEADGLTKPMMVLDLAQARALLAKFPGAGALWIDKNGRIAAVHDMRLVNQG